MSGIHARSRALHTRSLAFAGLTGAVLLSVSPVTGAPKDGPKDAEALELAKKAIYTDYLGTKFSDAEKKLKQALALCEPATMGETPKPPACSARVRAKLLCDLGIVYLGGLSRADDGKAQF